MSLHRVVAYVRDQPWAILPSYLAVLVDLVRLRDSGARLTPDEIQARLPFKADRPREQRFDPETGLYYREAHDAETGMPLGYRAANGEPMRGKKLVSVLGVIGPIFQRAAQIDDVSGPGGTSIERLTARFRAALDDPAVTAIVFDHDSPGGGVYGVQELADEIRAGRGVKPIAAVANSLAASASYWLYSQVDPGEAYVTPSGEVGSVGVYAAHEDISGLLEKEGVKVTLISHGANKTEGNPFEPLSEEARQHIQTRVADYGRVFENAVAKGRGVSVDVVRSDFGQGRVYGAKEAVSRKMADQVDTLDNVVRRLAGRRGDVVQPAAEIQGPVIQAGPTALEMAEMEAAEIRRRTL